MTLMNWDVYNLPMDDAFMKKLAPASRPQPDLSRPGVFFKGTFIINDLADTFIDMTNYQKGIVWVNGHNLGRYWNIGPQFRLYCPATFLKKGANEVIVFDLHQTEAKPLAGKTTIL
jgi:beta-galactosidase GanA